VNDGYEVLVVMVAVAMMMKVATSHKKEDKY